MEYMLNELSLKKVKTKMQAYGLMENFVHAAVEAERQLNLDRLRIDESLGDNLYDLYLVDGYSIGAWFEDYKVDSDLKAKFLSIVSLSPLVDGELKWRFEDENCYHNGVLGLGIKASLICDTFCVNFLTADCWKSSSLSVVHEYIEEGELKSVDALLKCFSDRLHVSRHAEWFRKFREDNLKNSKELWVKRQELFPYLLFCANVKQNVARMGNSTNLNNVINRLRVLDDIAQNWNKGNFNYEEINKSHNITIHAESQLTLDNYRAVRNFRVLDGTYKTFSLHILVGDLRIHFYPDNESRKIYVGYIGIHLRTWLY